MPINRVQLINRIGNLANPAIKEANSDNEVLGLMLEERLAEVAAKIDSQYHYQLDHIRVLVRAILKHDNALDTSDTGTGKTFTACGAAYVLGMDLFVVCPISVRPDWIYAAELLGVRLIESETMNYEILRGGTTPYVDRIEHRRKVKKKVKGKTKEVEVVTYSFKWHTQIVDNERTLFVFDEVHRCKDYTTQNANMAIAAVDACYPTLMQSATAADNPMEMKVVALASGMIRTPDEFFGWMMAHGVEKAPVYGYSKQGKPRGPRVMKFVGGDPVLDKIHRRLFPEHGGRMRIKDLGDRFPKTQILWVPYKMPDAAEEIQKVYMEMRKEIAKLRARAAQDKGTSILTAKLRARQKVELLKVPYFVELAQDAIDDGHAVILFVNFEDTLVALASRLGTQAVIHGDQDFEHRNQVRDAFNADEIPCIVANAKAGGEGIGLAGRKGGKARRVFISPNYSGPGMKQVFGRAPRGGGCPSIQKVIFAADTVEEDTCYKVRQKMHRIDIFNEGINWNEMTAVLDIE